MVDYKRRFLLLASYCDDCTEDKPCLDCLNNCNVYSIPQDTELTYISELQNLSEE